MSDWLLRNSSQERRQHQSLSTECGSKFVRGLWSWLDYAHFNETEKRSPLIVYTMVTWLTRNAPADAALLVVTFSFAVNAIDPARVSWVEIVKSEKQARNTLAAFLILEIEWLKTSLGKGWPLEWWGMEMRWKDGQGIYIPHPSVGRSLLVRWQKSWASRWFRAITKDDTKNWPQACFLL